MLVDMLGINIKLLRQQHGLTQEALALECDMATSTIQRIEYGKIVPSIQKLSSILTVLGFRLRLEKIGLEAAEEKVHIANNAPSLSDALSSDALRNVDGLIIDCPFLDKLDDSVHLIVENARCNGQLDCVLRCKSGEYVISTG